MSTPHIESKKEEIAKIVLMPGDPKRCQYIAEKYLDGAMLVNSVRGETAYTGYYKNVRVTVFPSGMGIASMGIYSHELYEHYDVETIIRIGTAGSYVEDVVINDVVVVDSAFSETNFDNEVINKNMDVINSSFELNSLIMHVAALNRIDARLGRVHTTDAFYNSRNDLTKYIEKDCLCVEMECFALFLNAKKFMKKATAIVTISDELYSKKEMDSLSRERSLDKMITLALESIIKL